MEFSRFTSVDYFGLNATISYPRKFFSHVKMSCYTTFSVFMFISIYAYVKSSLTHLCYLFVVQRSNSQEKEAKAAREAKEAKPQHQKKPHNRVRRKQVYK